MEHMNISLQYSQITVNDLDESLAFVARGDSWRSAAAESAQAWLGRMHDVMARPSAYQTIDD